jgi:hypothetical protein
MSWKTFHNRGETLRAVVDTANQRRDGVLPMSLPGVTENFRDELDLIGALLLKWHARLSGNIERALTLEPMDLESAVANAWATTAEQMPGVRMVIDRYVDEAEDELNPATSPQMSPELSRAMNRAREHELARLATAAGLASRQDATAVQVGRRVEELARLRLSASATAPVDQVPVDEVPVDQVPTGQTATGGATTSFVDRIKAVIAA